MKRLRNICRMDDDSRGTHAWLVRVQRKGHVVIKMFSDGVHGGKRKALAAALDLRRVLITSPSPAEHNLWHRSIRRRNNTSGIPGVGLYKRPNGTERWVAFWINEHGVRECRSFAISVHGKRKAKQLAIAQRQHQLQRLFEIKSRHPPI